MLRLVKINESLAIDELITVRDHVLRDFSEIIFNYRTTNNHVLTSLLAKISSLVFGQYNWAYKLPSYLLSVGAVYLQFCLGRLWFDDDTAMAASALLAGSFFHVLYSTQVRGYAGLTTAVLLTLVMLSLGWKENKNRYWLGMGIAMVLGSPFHLFMFFTYLSCFLCGIYLYRRRWAESSARKFLITFAGAAVGIFLFYLPHLGRIEWIYSRHTRGGFFTKLYVWFVAGYFSAGPLFAYATVIYLAFFLMGFWYLRNWPERAGVALFFLLPALLMKYVIKPFPVLTRFSIFLLPLFLMVVAYGIIKVFGKRSWVGVLLLLLLNVPVLTKYHSTKLLASSDAVGYIDSFVKEGEWIVCNGLSWRAFNHYQSRQNRLVLFDRVKGEKARDFMKGKDNVGMWYLTSYKHDRFSDSVFSFRPKWAEIYDVIVGERPFYFQESFRGVHPLGSTLAAYYSPPITLKGALKR